MNLCETTKAVMEINELTEKIIGLAIEVHKHLGPGLLESAYKECLLYEIKKTGLHVECEKILSGLTCYSSW